MNPIKAYRSERKFRVLAQRALDYSAANGVEDGVWPFDGRGATLVFNEPFWRAVVRRTLGRS